MKKILILEDELQVQNVYRKKLTIEPKTPFLIIEKAHRSGSSSYDETNIGSPSFLQTVLGG